MSKRIGILTAGSDCPGLNAAIRALGKAAYGSYGMELVGFIDGFEGLINDQTLPIENGALSNILTSGGTILGTSRRKPATISAQHPEDQTQAAVETYRREKLDALVCLGGLETQESALRLSQLGLNIITMPKAIDNNIPMTDVTVGFDTALGIATEALDRLHSTAHSHHRIIIVEIMGNDSGWLTLGAGSASGADVILIPEIPYDVQKVTDAILLRNQAGKRFSIVAVAEGARSKESVQFFEKVRQVNDNLRTGDERDQVAAQLNKIEERATGNTELLANRLELLTGLETRITILGYVLRGGTPSPADRILATLMGATCMEWINQGRFGVMTAARGNTDCEPVPLEQVVGNIKTVPLEHAWVTSARRVGISLGD